MPNALAPAEHPRSPPLTNGHPVNLRCKVRMRCRSSVRNCAQPAGRKLFALLLCAARQFVIVADRSFCRSFKRAAKLSCNRVDKRCSTLKEQVPNRSANFNLRQFVVSIFFNHFRPLVQIFYSNNLCAAYDMSFLDTVIPLILFQCTCN
uniref:Uncharacterized protein n=1 Tax=Trichuris muris TaxID=70415 RepID=A0A5S6R1E2_TRIMR